MDLQDVLKFVISVIAGASISQVLYKSVDQDLILVSN
jgi:hypothetical protein